MKIKGKLLQDYDSNCQIIVTTVELECSCTLNTTCRTVKPAGLKIAMYH